MKQEIIITKLKEEFPKFKEIKAAILIGSFARKDARGRSDIDYSLWVKENFNPEYFANQIENALDIKVINRLYIPEKKRIVFYFAECPKLELIAYTRLEDTIRNYLGSEITDIAHSLQYVQPNLSVNLFDFFTNEIKKQKENTPPLATTARRLIDEFIYYFEAASDMHSRSDAFKFYFLYNIALDRIIRLSQVIDKNTHFLYEPKYFTQKLKKEEEREQFYNLSSSLFLPDANTKKRNLLNYFYMLLGQQEILNQNDKQNIKKFLERIYERDYLWNFRDVALNMPIFKTGKILRSSSFSRYQNDDFFPEFIKKHHIRTVVDLRADYECLEDPYTEKALKLFQYKHFEIDPCKQSEEFKKKYHYGTNNQIAYRHYAVEHKHIFKSFFEETDPTDGAIMIHCNAGKDRTGSVIALLALLMGVPINMIYADYLYSDMCTTLDELNSFLEIIEQEGGAEKYIENCGVSKSRIKHWKQNLIAK